MSHRTVHISATIAFLILSFATARPSRLLAQQVCSTVEATAFVAAEEALENLVTAEQGYKVQIRVLEIAKDAAHHKIGSDVIVKQITEINAKVARIQIEKIIKQKVMHEAVSRIGSWACIRAAVGTVAKKGVMLIVPGVLIMDAFLSMQGTASAAEKNIDLSWISTEQCISEEEKGRQIQMEIKHQQTLIDRNEETRSDKGSRDTYNALKDRYKKELDALTMKARNSNNDLKECIEIASKNLAEQIDRDNKNCKSVLSKHAKEYSVDIKCTETYTSNIYLK